MYGRLITLLFFILLLAGCKPAAESEVTAIVGAVLIDGAGGPPISDSVVLVSGSRIRAAGPRATTPIPAGSEKIDGSEKFLVPGLIDLHVHLGARAGPRFVAADYTAERIRKNLNSYLYFGVTSVRSMGTDREAGLEVRESQRNAPPGTARLFTAGRGFTAPGGHPSQEVGDIARQPRSPAEARSQVKDLAAGRVDAIKIWVDEVGGRLPKIQPAISEAILEEARVHKIPVTAHIHSLADTMFLLDRGAAGFLHMIRDTENIDPAFIARLRNLQIVFAPTLVRQELAWLLKEQPRWLSDPEIGRAADPETVAAVKSFAASLPSPSAEAREQFERAVRNTKSLAQAGVPIGTGSDGGSAFDFPGLMLHRELEILVEAGLTPLEVIQAATRNGTLALGKMDELGVIQAGRRADLLLLRANPAEDIRNLRKIDRLMLDGQWVDRARLP
ncbi:MAG: amidohydrolase family protein [Acidobacteria bacterium]|nr:amidohydrolase family protein [Acidobacteriota bacterium]